MLDKFGQNVPPEKLHSSYSIPAFARALGLAWREGTDAEKKKLEELYPEIFLDATLRWRTPDEMAGAIAGEYFCIDREKDDYILYYNGKEKVASDHHGSHALEDFACYYGPIVCPTPPDEYF